MTTCLNCGHEGEAGFLFCPQCGTKAPETAEPVDPLLGRTLNGKYRVLAEIGSGAMGTVYRGEHIVLKKRVALKVLHTDLQLSDEQLQRFQREGIAAGKFSHPNAIQIFDFDRAEGRVVYLAMEFVEGMNLRHYLRSNGPLSVAVSIQMSRQILSCLSEAHNQGIVHRDLKPDNIMVVPGSGSDVRIKVLDFGLSKLVDAPGKESTLLTQAGRILGTPLYMSPEQSAGDPTDARSDLYAVGLMLYEAVSGMRPFSEDSMTELLFTRATKEAPSLLEEFPDLRIPRELDAVIVRSLARRREDRFQTAQEMLGALEAVPLDDSSWTVSGTSIVTTQAAVRRMAALGGDPSETGAVTVATGTAPAQPAASSRKRAVVIGVALLIMVGAAAALRFFDPFSSEDRSAPAFVSMIPTEERTPTQDHYARLLSLARTALRSGTPAAARTTINDALQIECVDAEGYLIQAEVFHALDDDDAAIASYRTALAKNSNYVDALLGLAWIHIDRAEWDEASARVDEAARNRPNSAAVLTAEGVVAYRRNDTEEADRLLSRAVEIDATFAQAWLFRGRLLLDERRYDEASAALIEAKRTDPTSWHALSWLGETYLALDRTGEAETQWNASLELHDSLEVRQQLATLILDSGRFDQARRFLGESIVQHERDGRLHILRGVALYATRDNEGAIDELRQGIDLGAGDGESRILLALLYHAAGNLDSATTQYEHVIADLGDVPRANLGLGIVLFERAQYERAAERFASVIDYEPDNLAARLHLGLLHMDFLGNPDEARTHLNRYVELGGTDRRVPTWLRSLGG